jgi:uncharacterized protein YmfQ (DUF2313 family)
MLKNDSKMCIIHNGRFCYELIVDKYNIHFTGSYNVEYFERHYSALGYKVIVQGDGSKNYKEV